MHNQILFFARLLIDFLFVFWAFRVGKEWLFASIVINLVLISIFGREVVHIGHFSSNVGNAFYAAVFLAIHLLTEHYGKKEALKTVWVGFSAMLLFTALSQLTISYNVSNDAFDNALLNIFKVTPRIALASILPYIMVQYLNISLYDYLHKRDGAKRLWLRDSVSTIVGQSIDTVLFFSIAFLDILPGVALVQAIVTGLIMKILAGFLGTGLMYLSYSYKKK